MKKNRRILKMQINLRLDWLKSENIRERAKRRAVCNKKKNDWKSTFHLIIFDFWYNIYRGTQHTHTPMSENPLPTGDFSSRLFTQSWWNESLFIVVVAGSSWEWIWHTLQTIHIGHFNIYKERESHYYYFFLLCCRRIFFSRRYSVLGKLLLFITFFFHSFRLSRTDYMCERGHNIWKSSQ